MRSLIAGAFDETEVAVVTGGAEAARAFSELPFDHLIFTGSTAVGRHVMAAAARNLVPVTLELGGKSPTIVSRSADLARATERIAMGKMMNAGQICLAPDYLLVPRENEAAVIAGLKAAVGAMYPTLLANPDYTSAPGTVSVSRRMSPTRAPKVPRSPWSILPAKTLASRTPTRCRSTSCRTSPTR